MQAKEQRFLLLDALRGVAALAVVCGHLGDAWGHPIGQLYILAVDFFFILSGFVVAHAYRNRLETSMSAATFCQVRIIRLYPLLVVGALLGGLAMFLLLRGEAGHDTWRIAASTGLAMLALPTLLIEATYEAFPINPPAWSLFFELVANFVYGFTSRLLTRNQLVLVTLLAAGLLIVYTLHRGTIESGWSKTDFLGGLLRVFFGFACGLLLYEIRPSWRLAQAWGWALAALLAVVLLFPAHGYAKAHLLIVLLVMPAIVWLGSAVETGGALSRAGLFLGALSYPIYILHLPILRISTDIFQRIAPALDWRIWSILQIMLFVGIAWAALKLFDEPVRSWLQRATRRRQSSVTV